MTTTDTGVFTEQVTAFAVRYNDGPTITATCHGDCWSFTFQGKTNDDRMTIDVDYQEARILAMQLATKIASLEPLRREYESERRALSTWLKDQVKGAES